MLGLAVGAAARSAAGNASRAKARVKQEASFITESGRIDFSEAFGEDG